jgi:hypothetical protein
VVTYSPASPEGKILAALCDMRVDQGFLTPERLSEVTGLHVKLVESALAELEALGSVSKEDNLLKKSIGQPARGHWWKPTAAGYQALYGQKALDSLKVKVMTTLESQTEYLPDAYAGDLRGIYLNFDLVTDVLRELEEGGFVSSQPSLTRSSELSWALSGHGARVLEDARIKATVSKTEQSFDL